MAAPGLELDSGALIAFERGSESVHGLLTRAVRDGRRLSVVAGVVAQTWRDGSRQVRLARLLNLAEVTCAPMDALTARAVGEVCGRTGHHDVVDVHVVVHARLHGHAVVTSDPDDLRRVDPHLPLIIV